MIAEGLALLLLAVAGISLARLVYGPGTVDRMLVAQLMGSVGVGVTLALSPAGPGQGGLTVALVLALLAAVSGVAFARRYGPPHRDRDRNG